MRPSVPATTLRALWGLSFALSTWGCGGDGDEGAAPLAAGTCGLLASVSGGQTIQFLGNDDVACLTQHSFDTGLDGAFIGLNAKGTLEIAVEDVAEGEIGDGYPTRIAVTNAARERWQSTACLTSFSEHSLKRAEASEIGELRHYQVSGEGECSEPLESIPPGGPDVTLGRYAFRAEFTWRD